MLTTLPTELILRVLDELPWKSLVMTMQVSHFFLSMISDSSHLKYVIELGCAGMVDGVFTTRFTSAVRLEKVQDLQRAWTNLTESSRDSIRIDAFIPTYDLQKGVLAVGTDRSEPWRTSTIRYHRLRSRVNEITSSSWSLPEQDVHIRDFTTDPAQDLIVILEDVSDRDLHLCQLQLRTMSTGEQHPSAKETVLSTRTGHLPRDVEGMDTYSLILRGRLLAFICTLMTEDGGQVLSHVWIWDWSTARLITTFTDTATVTFSFIDDFSFLLAVNETAYSRTAAWRLEVHYFSIAQGKSTRSIRLGLPKLKSGEIVLISEMLLRSDPNDSGPAARLDTPVPARGKTLRGDEEDEDDDEDIRLQSDERAFYADPDQRIIVLSWVFTHIGGPHNTHHRFSIIMQGSAVLSLASKHLQRGTKLEVPWNDWGPPTTRWIKHHSPNPYVTDMHGQRYITSTSTGRRGGRELSSALAILDFNPCVVRKEARTLPSASPLDEWEFASCAQSRLVTESTYVALPYAFKEPIVSSLPYKETFYPVVGGVEEDSSAFCIDQERVLIFRVSGYAMGYRRMMLWD